MESLWKISFFANVKIFSKENCHRLWEGEGGGETKIGIKIFVKMMGPINSAGRRGEKKRSKKYWFLFSQLCLQWKWGFLVSPPLWPCWQPHGVPTNNVLGNGNFSIRHIPVTKAFTSLLLVILYTKTSMAGSFWAELVNYRFTCCRIGRVRLVHIIGRFHSIAPTYISGCIFIFEGCFFKKQILKSKTCLLIFFFWWIVFCLSLFFISTNLVAFFFLL